ncbi:DUF7127 family protein [Halodesulfurarchaeum formicicum]|uniref:DUF7127 family protein n=1 Tax=Halodesulfurarchaeum formicicum TaxID=1873524 RepID=UPI000878F89C|nr:hypothetical protein [Halodesulfurarchaeum formicicum]
MERNAQVRSDVPVRRYQTDSGARIVADLGASVADASVEVLGDVALVVVERTDGEDRQFEIDLPTGSLADTFIRNGILTIEVNEA